MDPNAAVTTMRDETISLEDRQEAANALLRWVACGGFMPINLGYKVGGNGFAKSMLRNEISALLKKEG